MHEKDLVLLTDIFPTGWGSVVQSGFKPGETIAIFGPGPVGLMLLTVLNCKEHPNTIIDIIKKMFTFFYFVI